MAMRSYCRAGRRRPRSVRLGRSAPSSKRQFRTCAPWDASGEGSKSRWINLRRSSGLCVSRAAGEVSARRNDRNLQPGAARPQDLERNVVPVAADLDVDARTAELQIAQRHLIEERRQPRIAETHFVMSRIEFQSQGCLDQRERGGARPGLRRAGDGIERRPAVALALEAAEELR